MFSSLIHCRYLFYLPNIMPIFNNDHFIKRKRSDALVFDVVVSYLGFD